MKIHTAGARFFGGQVSRIDEGFTLLGHELVERMVDADLLYSNDPNHYKDVLSAYHGGRLKAGARLVFNVLDIPEHNIQQYDLIGLEAQLAQAHAVTCISTFVQKQLIQYLKRGSTVVYNPIKPVTCMPEPRADRYTRYLSAGRRSDPNKRFNVGVHALQLLGVNYGQLALVGNEPGGWGEYLGVLKDADLTRVYNSVDFVLATGKIEGLNLPVLEGMAAGIIPVVCADMTTRTELLPPDLFPEYEDVHPTATSVSRFIAQYLGDNDAMMLMKARLHKHYLDTWYDRVSPVGVAAAIVKVYEEVKA